MKKSVLFLVLMGTLTACTSKKRYSNQMRTQSVLAEHNKKRHVAPTKPQIDAELSLPKKPSKFVVFKIDSPQEYINTFAETAQLEMLGYGIPASITLAQGLLESGFGKGELAVKTNNHFGIKCHKGWQGDYDFHDDDEKGECFRKYNHPSYSFRDHSLFLTSRSRYAFLFNLRHTNYKAWAKGLKKAGYATDPKYPQKLIYLIEKYDLHQYDTVKPTKNSNDVRIVKGASEILHKVEKGETLYFLSKKYNTSVEEIMHVNNLKGATLSIGQELKVVPRNTN